MEQQEVELIDYLKVIWKRKGLIMGGTLVAAAAALVVSLSMPKTYEVSRTLKIGRLPGSISSGRVTEGKLIETQDDVIARLNDHRILRTAVEKIHPGLTSTEMNSLVSIGRKTNPNVHYTVQANDPEVGRQIADQLAEYIIKVHRPIFDIGLQIAKSYEAELETTGRKTHSGRHPYHLFRPAQEVRGPSAGSVCQKSRPRKCRHCRSSYQIHCARESGANGAGRQC